MFKTVKRIIDWCGELKGRLYAGFVFSFFSHIFAAMPLMAAAYTVGLLIDAQKGGAAFDTSWIWKCIVIQIALALKCGSVGLALAASLMCLNGRMDFSMELVFIFFSFSIFASLEPISDSAHTLSVIDDAMDQLDALRGEHLIDAGGKDIPLEHYDIEFSHVSFGYDSRQVLSDVSFTIPEKTSTAIVGPSGSGKTTICSLLARFYDPQQGSISVGGHNLKELTCDSLLSNISMVFQNVYLFNDTIFFSFSIFASLEPISDSAHTLSVIDDAMDQLDALRGEHLIDAGGKDIPLEHYDIEFSHVSFGYDSRQVLSDVSFTIPEKTSTAIVGPSGSGKTTICSLLARFYDPQQGSISVGGHNLKELTCDSLLSNISMVFQNVYLFNDTIRANICFGKPDATEAEMIAAAKRTRCHDFIMALPNGYDTVVGEGGGTLSGGEKQRISIARAMLKDAPIIILDEAQQ